MQQSGNFQKPSLTFVCPEDWNKMKPCEQGRFCRSCQKTVVDFTQKSEEEIQAMLAKRKGEMCGRFYAHQLTQPVHANPFSFRRVFSSVLVLFGLSFLSKEAEAQQHQKTPIKKQPDKSVPSKTKKIQKEVVTSPDRGILTGDVIITTGIIAIDGPHPDADVLYHAEIMPEYKFGGMAGMQEFLKKNKKQLKVQVEGMVLASFIIDTLGHVNNIQILNHQSEEANTEALRLINLLQFQPGFHNGEKVRVRYTLPIRF